MSNERICEVSPNREERKQHGLYKKRKLFPHRLHLTSLIQPALLPAVQTA